MTFQFSMWAVTQTSAPSPIATTLHRNHGGERGQNVTVQFSDRVKSVGIARAEYLITTESTVAPQQKSIE